MRAEEWGLLAVVALAMMALGVQGVSAGTPVQIDDNAWGLNYRFQDAVVRTNDGYFVFFKDATTGYTYYRYVSPSGSAGDRVLVRSECEWTYYFAVGNGTHVAAYIAGYSFGNQVLMLGEIDGSSIEWVANYTITADYYYTGAVFWGDTLFLCISDSSSRYGIHSFDFSTGSLTLEMSLPTASYVRFYRDYDGGLTAVWLDEDAYTYKMSSRQGGSWSSPISILKSTYGDNSAFGISPDKQMFAQLQLNTLSLRVFRVDESAPFATIDSYLQAPVMHYDSREGVLHMIAPSSDDGVLYYYTIDSNGNVSSSALCTGVSDTRYKAFPEDGTAFWVNQSAKKIYFVDFGSAWDYIVFKLITPS